MNKWDRANEIRDQILRRNVDEGFFLPSDRGLERGIVGEGWRALLQTPDYARSEQLSPKPWRWDGTKIIAPNRLTVWLTNGRKVLKMGWLQDAVGVYHYVHGKWESEIFDLPPYRVRRPRRPSAGPSLLGL